MKARLIAALRAIDRFFFAPARPAPLVALRIGLAAVLLAQALQIAPLFRALYHHRGLLRGPLKDAFGSQHLPSLGELLASPFETQLLAALGAVYVAGLVGMLLGWRTRLCTGAAWLLHLGFMHLAPHTNYGADHFANIFLFYSTVAPGGAFLSLDRRAGRASDVPTAGTRLAIRVMQIHLCIAYLLSGTEKAMGHQWHDGEAIWRSLVAQGYELLDFTWLAHVPWLAVASGWLVLVVEIGYAVLIWPARTRRWWVAAVAAMHAGIGVFMGLHVFAGIMIVLTVAMFGVSAEPAVTVVKQCSTDHDFLSASAATSGTVARGQGAPSQRTG
ncbi:HTTM domain-containing protein [Nannocystis punicea]|uniref:HTTM domain-containing protein n=1 Tax=Nannocystis punicea TaxID=2995304 RepID=A0ABY7GZM9_9BACT|nr:HTTM domain-containing protein [Nannocystis poenicansa]WAS92446.1 HTTM domain-containing protein [Nannocystis poenicansa]